MISADNDPAPEGLTLDAMAKRLHQRLAITMDHARGLASYVLTGLSPGHRCDARLADILARLAGAAPAGEGVASVEARCKAALFTYLIENCSYAYGNGYDEPKEHGIEYQWQQSTPSQPELLDTLTESAVRWVKTWHSDIDIDAEPTGYDREMLEYADALQVTVGTVVRARLAATPSPARTDWPEAEGRGKVGDLINLIEKRIIGIRPDEQDVELEDADWKIILAALASTLTPPATFGLVDLESGKYWKAPRKLTPDLIEAAAETPISNFMTMLLAQWEAIRVQCQKSELKAILDDVFTHTTSDAALSAAPTLPAGEGVDLPSVETLAEVIHLARWKDEDAERRTPFVVEDRQGREYCLRIATAIRARLTTPATGTDEALRVAAQKAVDAWLADEYGSDVFPDAMGDLRTALGASGVEG